MSMQDDPLQEAQGNAQRMAMSIEQGLNSEDPTDMQAQVQEAIRYGEPARSFLEEALDSTDDEQVMLHAEQALESMEEALDEANQALFSSEATMKDHVQMMSAHAEQAVSHIDMAMGMEVS